MKYSAVCFDLDGVIVNSESLHEAAFRTALAQYDLPLTPYDYKIYFAGKTDQRGFVDYLSQQQTKAPLPDLLTSKQQAFATLTPSKHAYYEGVPDLIRNLTEVTPLALVTGSSPEETEIALKPQNLRKYFSTIVTAGDVAHSKPNPESYLLAAKQLIGPIAPTACIAVEDSPSGVLAAKGAGMYCIAVTNTHAAEQLQTADTVVDRLSLAIFTQLIDE